MSIRFRCTIQEQAAAHLGEPLVHDLALVIHGLSPRTAKTITDVTELKTYLEVICHRG